MPARTQTRGCCRLRGFPPCVCVFVGVLCRLGGPCRWGGRCRLAVPVRVIPTRFEFYPYPGGYRAFPLLRDIALSDVRRSGARWQTATRRTGVAPRDVTMIPSSHTGPTYCPTPYEVWRSRVTDHVDPRHELVSNIEETRCRVNRSREMSLGEDLAKKLSSPAKLVRCNDIATVKLHADNRVILPTSPHVR